MSVKIGAAIILDKEGRLLICQRPLGKHLALLWEFPGGKIEVGETAEQCVIRECKEELDANIEVCAKYGETSHLYENTAVHIEFFICRITKGEPFNKEHPQIKWVNVKELANYEFCPADKEIIEKLSQGDLGAVK